MEVAPATEPDAALPHGQSVGFLLSQLGYETARRFGELMREIGLEPRQFALMRAIRQLEGQSQNAVGEFLRIPRSSLVAVIDDLEGRGLAVRRPHPSDRRTHALYLTRRGERLLGRGMELAMGFERVVCEGFGHEERAQLIGRLSRVADNLGLVTGLHPDTSTGHGEPHWTDEEGRRPGTR
jgi:DNA-binding MarR family transcriptional regulator